MFLCLSLPKRPTSPKRSLPFSTSVSALHSFFTATIERGW
uniref:Uncharacterized protein n=1 Tax=Rhizophora mucronata TaxID=61149 RepID=A0A2P2P7R2_RHIMU